MFDFYPDPWGDDPIWRAYFSDGLQPLTRSGIFMCWLTEKNVAVGEFRKAEKSPGFACVFILGELFHHTHLLGILAHQTSND